MASVRARLASSVQTSRLSSSDRPPLPQFLHDLFMGNHAPGVSICNASLNGLNDVQMAKHVI